MSEEKKDPQLGCLLISAGLMIFWSLVAAIVICLYGCSKKDDTPQEKTYAVHYTLYSSTPKYLFSHSEDIHTSGSSDTIRANAYSVTLQVKENILPFSQGLTSLIASPVDSLYIKAEYDGKKVEKGFRSAGGIFSVNIHLEDAK